MEESQLLTEYEPIDLGQIKPSKITTEKELEAEAAQICEILKDIKGDWNQRLKALLSIQSFLVSDDIREFSNFSNFMSKLVAPLTFQLQDLRSQITKEASKGISLMAQVMQQNFEPLAHRFISKVSLFKLLNAAKHVLAEHSHICIIAIINNVICPNAEYIYLILNQFPEDCYLNHIPIIEDLLISLIQDAKSEARQIARMAYFRYKMIFPDRSDFIFNHLDSQNQRAILDEEDSFVDPNFIASKARYTEKLVNKSPSKLPDSLGGTGSGFLGIPGASGKDQLKMTRSVSRGRPTTTSNNLTSKAQNVSPSGGHKKQMKSPDNDETGRGKQSRTSKLKFQQYNRLNVIPQIRCEQIKTIKESQACFLGSNEQKTNETQSLNFQSKAIVEERKLNQHQKQQDHQQQNQMNLGSPKLPPDRQQQLQSLREKKQKQLEEQQQKEKQHNFNPQNNSNNNNSSQHQAKIGIKSVNIAPIQTKQNSMVSPTVKKPNKFLNQKTQEEIDKQNQIKRQKSASPTGGSPKSSLLQQRDQIKRPENLVISQKQNKTQHNFNSQKQDSNVQIKDQKLDDSNYQTIPNQRQQPNSMNISKVKQNQQRMQVSHSIQNIQQAKNQAQGSSQMQQPTQIVKKDNLLDQNQLNSSDEQKIFEELDFLNQNESIESLVVSAQSSNLNERVRSFQMIKNSEDQLQECSDQLLKKLFKIHLDYLQDKDERVMVAVQESLLTLVQYKHTLVDKYLDSMIPTLLQNMVGLSEQVSILSSDLINIICLQQNASDIVLILMDLLREQSVNHKIVTAALEVLVVLLKDDQEYCNKNANVLETTLKIVELLETNNNNMDVIMPSIAVMLAMRDKNFEGTMKALLFLKSQQLNVILKLAQQFAPDFENDIKKNVLSDQVQNFLRGQSINDESEIDKFSHSQRSYDSHSFKEPIFNDTYNSHIDLGSQILQSEENLKENFQDIEKASPVNVLQQQMTNRTISDQMNSNKSSQRHSKIKNENFENDSNLNDDLDNFNELVNFTQGSSKNYIISKAGDVLDDQIEDGVSPKPRLSIIQDKINRSSEISEFSQILRASIPNQRQKIFDRIDETLLMEDPNNIISSLFEELIKFFFDLLKSDESVGIKEQSFKCLFRILQLKVQQTKQILSNIIEDIAIAYFLNKKMIPMFEKILSILVATQDQEQIFILLDKLMQNHQHPQLQIMIKMTTLLFKILNNHKLIDKYFSVMFENLFQVILKHYLYQKQLMSHDSANVRKSLVFCMVDMYFVMDHNDFSKYLTQFNVNQQKLVNIYIERKSGGSSSPKNE
ncbi:clip-associated protein [Stylonychia lemnae]|uniref:Clip-associated protein n=1 Tax=Stylonychia lemnae TaxID=5949 RepID=A0A078ADL0_STYLE|nr:clip-associated protein [Stylonychia lemnae]|eukprot:CDW80330.1 clip-associated protein [Stylonychia lemnae]